MANDPGTVPQEAPRHQRQVERQGVQAVPFVQRLPQVRGGVCEFCGILDKNVPSEQQYKLCPHYRGLNLRCSYCDETKDPEEIIGHAVLNVYEHPDNPDKLVVVCDSYTCTQKHEARFRTSA